ncbi:hypothetical protein RCZAHN_20 [Rhodobacter phage RcZahn]|nr:hypothetical protein RCZAHN_20 [Rhodobacter phage RcZahn]
MPKVATKTLNRLSMGGRIYTKAPIPVSYEEALALSEDPRLQVTITQAEHAAYHAKRALEPEAPVTDPTTTDPDDEDDDTSGGATEPTDPAERQEAIIAAAAELDPDDESNYTQAGLPDARALSKVLGWTVTAEERNTAFGAKKEVDVPEGGEKPKGKIVIRKKGDDTLDTGAADAAAAAAEGGADPSTEGAVTV